MKMSRKILVMYQATLLTPVVHSPISSKITQSLPHLTPFFGN